MDKQRWLRIVKIVGVIGCVVIVLLAIVLKVNAPRIAQVVGSLVVERAAESLSGKLAVGGIDFSLFGDTTLHNVVLSDNGGAVVATCNELAIGYSFADLLRGNLTMDKVQSIQLSGLKLNLIQDKAGRWNVENLFKFGNQPSEFRGKVVLQKCAVAVTTPQSKREIESLEGEVSFAGYPSVSADLAGKLQKTALKAQGVWNKDGSFALTFNADLLDLAEYQSSLPASAKITVTGGQLKDIVLTAKRDKDVTHVQGAGKISGLAANIDGNKLTDGQGSFRLTEQSLEIVDMTVAVSGQKVSVKGQASLAGTTPRINFSVAAQGYDPAGIKGAGALKGLLTFQATISGPIDQIGMYGNFQIPSGSFNGTNFSAAAGRFSYAQDILTFDKVHLSALDGALDISGTWNIKTAYFNQLVSGQNIDSALVTDKAVQGRTTFTANVAGPDVNHITIGGRFSMNAGTLSTIAFSSLEGQFAKQGNNIDLSGVSIVTSGQRLSASGNVSMAAGRTMLNLKVSSNGTDINVLHPNAPLKGLVAFQADVTGPADNFVASGNFQMPSVYLGRINFTAAKGSFHYANDLLRIDNVVGRALGGTMTTTGTITKDTVYNQKVTGQNVDAGFFTDRDVQGRANFTTKISGKGDWDNASADGSFTMKSGNIKGVSFSNMTGDFTKRGAQSDFSNLHLQMAGGLVNGTAFTDGDYIRLKLAPSDSPLALLLGLKLAQLIPQQELRIKFRGVK